MQILLIDDDVDLCDIMSEILADDGQREAVAPGAAEGLSLVRAIGPDLVFCDLHLGASGDGLELARQLRAECPTARLVALTGADVSDLGEQQKAAGFEQALRKPVPVDVIIASVTGQKIPAKHRVLGMMESSQEAVAQSKRLIPASRTAIRRTKSPDQERDPRLSDPGKGRRRG